MLPETSHKFKLCKFGDLWANDHYVDISTSGNDLMIHIKDFKIEIATLKHGVFFCNSEFGVLPCDHFYINKRFEM